MLAADADLQVRSSASALFNSDLHKLTNPFLVNRYKGIYIKNTMFNIERQELACIVTAVSQCRLCQVIGTKREELGILCDLVSSKCGTWQLYHGTYLVFYLEIMLFHHKLSNPHDIALCDHQFLSVPHKRNHYLWDDSLPPLCKFTCSLDDRFSLHRIYLRIGNTKPATTVPQHGV